MWVHKMLRSLSAFKINIRFCKIIIYYLYFNMKNNISVIIPNQGSDLSNDFLTELLKIDCEEIIFVGGILNLNIVDPRIKILENISKSNASINRNIGSEKTNLIFYFL